MRAVDAYLDDEQFAAIGRYAVYWAYLETELEFTMSAMSVLVRDDPKIPFGFEDRMKDWKKLIPQAIQSRHAARFYNSLARVALTAHATRSSLLHGRLVGDPRRKTRYMATEHHRHRHGNWNANVQYAQPRHVKRAANHLREIIYSLISLNRRYLPVEPYALPNRYPELSPAGQPRALPGHNDKSTQKARPRSLRPKLFLDRQEA